eukprot:6972644-Prymnesium_polylepis.1
MRRGRRRCAREARWPSATAVSRSACRPQTAELRTCHMPTVRGPLGEPAVSGENRIVYVTV